MQSQGSGFLRLSTVRSCRSSCGLAAAKNVCICLLPFQCVAPGADPNHADRRNGHHGSGCVNRGSVRVFVDRLFGVAGNHLQVKCYAKGVKLSCKRLCGMVPKVRCMGCIGCDVIISSVYGWNNRYDEGITKFYHSV